MRVTRKRLLAVELGKGGDEVDHPILHRDAERLHDTMQRLLNLADLDGVLKLVHAMIDDTRVLYVDATGPIVQQPSLWTDPDAEPVMPEDAAERIISHVREEIRRFVAAKQPLTLAQITRTAERMGTCSSEAVQLIRALPAARVDGESRAGPFSLDAGLARDYVISTEPLRVSGRVLNLGPTDATFKIEKKSHPKMSMTSRGEVPLTIEPEHRDPVQLTRLFKEYVLPEKTIALLVLLRHDVRSGRVTGLTTAGPLLP